MTSDIEKGPDDLQEAWLTCSDCHHPFVFTVAEQLFFRAKELVNKPKRCYRCRLVWRARRKGEEPKVVEAACDQCGSVTYINFKPTGIRPVLCGSCLHLKRSEGASSSSQA